MLRLSAFADEIAPGIDEQIRVCRANGITHIELRQVDQINVMDFSPAMKSEIAKKIADHGMGVLTIASPVGKVKISDPWPEHFDRFKMAVEHAEFFGAQFVRIFSYYPNGPQDDISRHRYEVLKRISAKVDYLKNHAQIALHENERDIYGEKGQACLDLLSTINSPKFRAAFDSANFVQAGEHPIGNWPLLKPYTAEIHIKDARLSDGLNVLPGTGDGDYAAILSDAYASGYRGFIAMEPHLSVAGQFSGFSGPEKFTDAVNAVKKMCQDLKIPLFDPGW